MALSPPQLAECLREVGAFLEELRPPPKLRDKLDYQIDICRSEVVFSSVRPPRGGNSGKVQSPLAKAKWIATRREWQLYWQRANGRWHAYDAGRRLTTIREALVEIRRDPHGCFSG